MPKKGTLGSDHFQSKFNVTVEDFGMKTKSDDGRPVHDVDSSNWYDTTIYNGVMDRRDGRFQLQMQWVDLDNNGHRIVLPHQVVEAIARCHKTIIKDSKSEGARKAAETRAEKGIIPFEGTAV
jgi:hypothetical protein|tara:strand:- start:90 stop:458 length:369 start_codon:yes stop_codon:yes gene_type:complete